MAKYATPIYLGPWSKQYKDMSIHEKINAKSWGYWRFPNPDGYMLTMIDNAIHDGYDCGQQYADYVQNGLAPWYHTQRPRPTHFSWQSFAVDCRKFIQAKA